jgi:hypothetical protein
MRLVLKFINYNFLLYKMEIIGSLSERLLAHSAAGENINQVPTNSEKWWAAITLGVLFALFSSGILYSITNSIISSPGINTWSGDCGGPTVFGLLLHTIIFTIVVRILM